MSVRYSISSTHRVGLQVRMADEGILPPGTEEPGVVGLCPPATAPDECVGRRPVPQNTVRGVEVREPMGLPSAHRGIDRGARASDSTTLSNLTSCNQPSKPQPRPTASPPQATTPHVPTGEASTTAAIEAPPRSTTPTGERRHELNFFRKRCILYAKYLGALDVLFRAHISVVDTPCD